MSEVRQWPTCGECSRVRGGWQPVEAYEIDDSEKPQRIISRGRVRVIARCSHGGALKQPVYQDSVIEVPMWWGNAHVLEAIRRLVFFKSGEGRPEHGLVTDI